MVEQCIVTITTPRTSLTFQCFDVVNLITLVEVDLGEQDQDCERRIKEIRDLKIQFECECMFAGGNAYQYALVYGDVALSDCFGAGVNGAKRAILKMLAQFDVARAKLDIQVYEERAAKFAEQIL